jgi:hypothetical protein
VVTIMADNDDDGESAAGGRLAHLLQILVRFFCLRMHRIANGSKS